jgi:hypothetical protein
MVYQICIPSYQRAEKLKKETLSTLFRFGVDREKINIFVVEKEYEEYKLVNPDYNIIVGVKGLINQKEFIENYFNEGDILLFLDDDITDFDLLDKSFDEFVMEAFRECLKHNGYIFSIYPVWNKFYREKQKYLTTCLNFCIGGFYGIINRKNENIKVSIYDGRDDIERSIKYFIEDGIVLRFNQIGFKTKFFSQGGLGLLKDRYEDINKSANEFLLKYPTYGKIKERKNGIQEFVLNKIIATPKHLPIFQFNIPSNTFINLFSQLEKIRINYRVGNSNRLGFPKFRGCVWGISKARYSGKIGLSMYSVKFPEIYQEIVRIGKLICPFDFTSIQMNKNLVCPSHTDRNNVGKSLLVSFGGNYEGNNIVVNGFEYNTNCKPLIFNGAELEHYNTPQISGTKYSLIFFDSKLIIKLK